MYTLRERMTATKENGGMPPIKGMSRMAAPTEPDRVKGAPPDLREAKALLAAHKGLAGTPALSPQANSKIPPSEAILNTEPHIHGMAKTFTGVSNRSR
jgi:hypothetical protein